MIMGDKSKEMLTMALIYSIANSKMMVEKGVCSNDEWDKMIQDVAESIADVLRKKGDAKDMLQALANKEKKKKKKR